MPFLVMMMNAVPNLRLDPENPDYSECVRQRTDLTQAMNYGNECVAGAARRN